jgi:hypothetical protein
MRWRDAWLGSLLLLGCGSSSAFRPQATATGGYRLQCASTVAQCLERAKKWCGKDRLRVEQKTDDVVYGVPGHKTGAQGAIIMFRCGGDEPQWKLPARTERPASDEEAAPAPSAPKLQPAAPQRACVPGITQRCIGPGACAGGQACLPDGTGFGPCDCGPADAGAPSDAQLNDGAP